MKTRLKNDIINVLEYFECGLADVQEGSGEEQPKLKEIRSILRRLKANGAEKSDSTCNLQNVRQQSELLINFLTWHDSENLGCLPDGIEGGVDEYLKLINCG